MERQRILLVEDAEDLARLLERALTEEGFAVTVAPRGDVALRCVDQGFNLVILDLMLPDVPGETILDYLSQRLDHPPVLILTARGGVEDKVNLFRRGCDDYLTKPFALEELIGRARALLRRAPRALPEACTYEDIALDLDSHRLQVGEESVTLTPKESAICRMLLREPGKIVSRREILQSVWGLAHEPKTNFIEVHLANLRKKLGQYGREQWLQTVRSSGFFFRRPEASES